MCKVTINIFMNHISKCCNLGAKEGRQHSSHISAIWSSFFAMWPLIHSVLLFNCIWICHSWMHLQSVSIFLRITSTSVCYKWYKKLIFVFLQGHMPGKKEEIMSQLMTLYMLSPRKAEVSISTWIFFVI